jgi:transposase InsO family protein
VAASAEALFRYQVVSLALTLELGGLGKEAAVDQVAGMEHRGPRGELRQVSRRTVYRWLKGFAEGGMDGLEPGGRERVDGSRVLPGDLLGYFQQQKKADPRASVPEIIRRARESGLLDPAVRIDRSTAYRACKRLGLEVARRKSVPDRDTRRFAYPHRLDMVLSDGKHFRAGASRAKRLAMFFLDDCSRYGLHVVVGTSENSRLFLRGLYEMIRRFGLMSIFYLDHGSGFIAEDTMAVIAALGALLIHGEVAYPEGHGKIERFHRTAKAGVLRGLDRRPDVDPDCGSLELRLQHYLREVYNHQPHESLGGQSPAERFWADDKPLRFPDNDAALHRCFNVHLERRVSADHVVSVDSVLYEMPRGHAGARVVLERNVLDDRLRFCHQGRMIELAPLDPVKNARARRAHGRKRADDEIAHPLPSSAADMVYDREMGPVVDPDGGLTRAPHGDKED